MSVQPTVYTMYNAMFVNKCPRTIYILEFIALQLNSMYVLRWAYYGKDAKDNIDVLYP